jgi:hypothetical protein
MPWQALSAVAGCKLVTPPGGYGQMLLFQTSVDRTAWLVAPYNQLTSFATDLRHNEHLRDFLVENRIRIGLRSVDVPPANAPRQKNYGNSITGQNHDKDFTDARVNALAQPVNTESAALVNRKTDREENVNTFWEIQTPQSHHVVEFNNLEMLGVSLKTGSREMDYLQLPAVLLAAEFHQRYISAILKPTHQMDRITLNKEIVCAYRELYTSRSRLFEPLWLVSQVILQRAGFTAD